MYARRALCLKAGRPVERVPEPFSAIILCTAEPAKVDYRTRSKWSRALRYAAKLRPRKLSLAEFMKSRGGINECAARFARRLGRAASENGETESCKFRTERRSAEKI
jgi:hypothetical protein